MPTDDLKKHYTEFYNKSSLIHVYPNEFIVRIFQGEYPNLNMKKNYNGKNILDIGMGDGRNLKYLLDIGFNCFGIEIAEQIINKLKKEFYSIGYSPILKVGENASIPFNNKAFDYLLSWNSCYYMGEYIENKNYSESFDNYLSEFSRVLCKRGTLIASIPMNTHSIYQNAISIDDRYVIIKDDPYKIRNNQVMASFEDKNELIKVLSKHFSNFKYENIISDCFGLYNNWHIIICEK